MSPSRTPALPTRGREFLRGVGMLGRGFRLWSTNPGLMLLGSLPALIVAIAYLVGLIALIANVDALSAWATSFADAWDPGARTAIRVLAVLAFLAVAGLLVVYTFTAVTLTIGAPFYERIWKATERRLGDAPAERDESIWRVIGKGLGDGIAMLVPALVLGVSLFVVGFIPVVGQVLAVIVGALGGGWLLATELTGFAFDGRGYRLRERRRALRANRFRVLGFGAATWACFLIPGGAVLAMPAAVAGATLLSRSVLETDPASEGAGPARTTS